MPRGPALECLWRGPCDGGAAGHAANRRGSCRMTVAGFDGELVVARRPMRGRAVFLDKDGTLIEKVPYNVDPKRVVLARGAGAALRDLKARGFRLIVVSNQAGVAMGRFGEHELAVVERRIQDSLAPSDAVIDAFYYCTHLPDAPSARYAVRCLCRKPQPGLLRRAARDLEDRSRGVLADRRRTRRRRG